MNDIPECNKRRPAGARWLLACIAAALSACGGGSADSGSDTLQTVATLADSSTTLQLDAAVLPIDAAALVAEPVFHAAPLLLEPPDDTDAIDPAASSTLPPRAQTVPAALQALSTLRLTVQSLQFAARTQVLSAAGRAADGVAAPMAGTGAVSTYSPAQIRAAYGLPVLPAAGSLLTAAQAAQLGAGQTIYIVDAMHDPNVAAELAVFNQKFGLPACTSKPIAAGTSLPLAVPSASSCELAVAYGTAGGTLSASAPAYDAGWATEITLDVQWAHATAPLARIVLIEAPDASLNSLLGAVKLANAMGPGVVSMSFGANEGNYTASVDAAFTAARMSYLAAAGDSGAGVSWPAVSPNVVAVGGTSLSYSGSGPRSEVVWSGTGGGISQYTPTPSYQTNAVPGLGTVAHRSVADVAFNADPATGQYVAVMSPGSTAVNWLSVGGTSLSTPQWAGIIAVANAVRAQQVAKPALGAPHAVLYGQVAAVPGLYASVFGDVIKGSDGSCSTCAAKAGYDAPTGLGTPNVSSLLSALVNAGATATPPAVGSTTIRGKVGTALSFSVAVTTSNPVSYSLSGAPSGMTVSAAGVVSWASPVAGSYSVTVSAKDAKTGLTGQGIYAVQISASGPVITASAMSGVAGKALSGTIAIADPGASSLSVSISGVPAGLAISASAMTLKLAWASPVVGSYTLRVVAVDSAGQSASANMPIVIAAK